MPEPPSGYSVVQLDVADIRDLEGSEFKSELGYGGLGALAFAVFRQEVPVAVTWYWLPPRYNSERGYWPLKDDEIKLVRMLTLPSERGRGLGTLLKNYSAQALAHQGFRQAYSRVWWTNKPSVRMNLKAGWQQCCLVVMVRLAKMRRSLRLEFSPAGVGRPRLRVFFSDLAPNA